MIFSQEEASFFLNPEPMILRQEIIKKLDGLLADVQTKLKSTLKEHNFVFPEDTDIERGKISRGENYQGLPWMMLDFPRLFSRDDTLVCRTFCWWGNTFAAHLLISGGILPAALENLVRQERKKSALSISVCANPWKHHYEKQYYLKLRDFSDEGLAGLVSKTEYLKLSAWFPLNKAEELPELVVGFFSEACNLTGLLSLNSQPSQGI